MKSTIDFNDWEKLDLVIGTIEEVEEIEGADLLYKLIINLGSEKRTVCAGVKKYISKEDLKGQQVVLLANLSPRMMRGVESQGMILAVGSKEDDMFTLIQPREKVKDGTRVS